MSVRSNVHPALLGIFPSHIALQNAARDRWLALPADLSPREKVKRLRERRSCASNDLELILESNPRAEEWRLLNFAGWRRGQALHHYRAYENHGRATNRASVFPEIRAAIHESMMLRFERERSAERVAA